MTIAQLYHDLRGEADVGWGSPLYFRYFAVNRFSAIELEPRLADLSLRRQRGPLLCG